jgi:hypothetical protein
LFGSTLLQVFISELHIKCLNLTNNAVVVDVVVVVVAVGVAVVVLDLGFRLISYNRISRSSRLHHRSLHKSSLVVPAMTGVSLEMLIRSVSTMRLGTVPFFRGRTGKRGSMK